MQFICCGWHFSSTSLFGEKLEKIGGAMVTPCSQNISVAVLSMSKQIEEKQNICMSIKILFSSMANNQFELLSDNRLSFAFILPLVLTEITCHSEFKDICTNEDTARINKNLSSEKHHKAGPIKWSLISCWVWVWNPHYKKIF